MRGDYSPSFDITDLRFPPACLFGLFHIISSLLLLKRFPQLPPNVQPCQHRASILSFCSGG